MRCDSCEALMINGVFCHESGCRRSRARYDATEEIWIDTVQCRECGERVDQGETCSCQETSELYYYVSVRYNLSEEGQVSEFQVLNHGQEHAQYFQGCGVSFTKFEYVQTGAGIDSESEALEDALEAIATSGHKLSDAVEEAIKAEL